MPEPRNATAPAQQPLSGRTALVTGGARRIGRAIGLALASAGADVAFTYNRSRADADDTVAALRGLGVRAHALPCDLHDPEAVAHVLPELSNWLASESNPDTEPALDILVNNAGAFEIARLDELTVAQWDAMFATNTRAPFLMAQAALPYLRRSCSTGRIVNIGSLGGMHPWATHAHYCASKAALHMLTQTMAKGWAPQVAVNCVAPGMIVTGSEPDEAYAHFAAKTPIAAAQRQSRGRGGTGGFPGVCNAVCYGSDHSGRRRTGTVKPGERVQGRGLNKQRVAMPEPLIGDGAR